MKVISFCHVLLIDTYKVINGCFYRPYQQFKGCKTPYISLCNKFLQLKMTVFNKIMKLKLPVSFYSGIVFITERHLIQKEIRNKFSIK